MKRPVGFCPILERTTGNRRNLLQNLM